MREILFKAKVAAPGRARWVEGLPCYSIKNRGKITGIIDKNSEVHPIELWELNEGEIVGNIHENPEFLEVAA